MCVAYAMPKTPSYLVCSVAAAAIFGNFSHIYFTLELLAPLVVGSRYRRLSCLSIASARPVAASSSAQMDHATTEEARLAPASPSTVPRRPSRHRKHKPCHRRLRIVLERNWPTLSQQNLTKVQGEELTYMRA